MRRPKVTANTDETMTTNETTTATETATKKTKKRRPVYVFVPVAITENSPASEVGDEALAATTGSPVVPVGAVLGDKTYAVYVCPGGEGQIAAVREVLRRHHIDPTNLGDALVFRGEPVAVKISQQLIVRF